jgi:CheY-like chemotaxis protein
MVEALNRFAGRGNAVPNQSKGTEAPKTFTILHVDDDNRLTRLTGRMLPRFGYQLKSAGRGPEALELFRKGGIDLVISDFDMPGMNGLQLLKALKALDPAVKVMILSGGVRDEEEKELRKAGVVAIMEKPFNVDNLANTIRTALETTVWEAQAPQTEGPLGEVRGAARVILVDGYASPEVVVAVGGMLGCEVKAASSVGEALGICESSGADVVVSDLRTPGMSVLELLSALKAKNPALKVIVAGGENGDGEKLALGDAGAFRVLGKPLEIGALQAAIAEALAR